MNNYVNSKDIINKIKNILIDNCADMISNGLKPVQCWSEWSSGGFNLYSSKDGRCEHDYLVKEIYKIINV